ncbi:hypothetical protein [Calothrix sp. NIES-2100]
MNTLKVRPFPLLVTGCEDFGKELRLNRSGVAVQLYEYETDKIGVLSV